MHYKKWTANGRGFNVEVMNGWSWDGNTHEKITINSNVVHEYTGSYVTDSNKGRMGLSVHQEIDGHIIQILCGSAWHFFGVACKIVVDGKRIGGDRFVWFAK